MMQHVDHDDIGGGSVRERKALRIGDTIEPRSLLDVGRNHVCEPSLQVADAPADLEREAGTAGRGDAIVKILIDETEDALALPHPAMIGKMIGTFHHIALMRMNANSTMRSNIKPCRKREICVSP